MGKMTKGKDEKLTSKSNTQGKIINEFVEEYKEALNLLTDDTRLTYIRWLQAKLFKELVEVVYR